MVVYLDLSFFLFMLTTYRLSALFRLCFYLLMMPNLLPLNSASENLALQKDLDNLLSWCQSRKLSLNTSKCAYMNVSLSSSTNNNYTIGNDTIKTVTQQKDLCILISDI